MFRAMFKLNNYSGLIIIYKYSIQLKYKMNFQELKPFIKIRLFKKYVKKHLRKIF